MLYLHGALRDVLYLHGALRDPRRYQVLEAQPEVLEAIHSVLQAKVVRRSIQLTPFGEDFCRVCLSHRSSPPGTTCRSIPRCRRRPPHRSRPPSRWAANGGGGHRVLGRLFGVGRLGVREGHGLSVS
jgi:hypothetical protein